MKTCFGAWRYSSSKERLTIGGLGETFNDARPGRAFKQMKPNENLRSTVFLIQSEALYFAIFDKRSSVNTREAGREAWGNLGDLQDFWRRQVSERGLLVWMLLADGVFRIAVTVGPPGYTPQIPEARLDTFTAHEGGTGFLVCPSGALVVNSLARLGEEDLEPVMEVEPGVYRVWLELDDEQVRRHEFLDQLSQYPPGDGPDWVLHLSPAAQ